MALAEVLIKNFEDYLKGAEIEATSVVKGDAMIRPGDHVLVYKDSIAARTNISVPKGKEDHSIGVEGTVVKTELREPVQAGSRIQILRIKKI